MAANHDSDPLESRLISATTEDVSVIIPSFNRLWALPSAVESCRSKEIAVQIIVIDDASVDGTAEWLATQNDLTVVQGEGWGKPWGVNRAMALATGKYLRILDSDDWLNRGANETQFELAEREQADLVVAGLDIYRDSALEERIGWVHTDDFIAQQLGEGRGSHYSAFLFRREILADIPHRTLFPGSGFASRDDRCMILEVALKYPRISVCEENTLCHRQHAHGRLQFHGGLAGTGAEIQLLHIYRQVLRLLRARGELSERRARAAVQVLWPLAHRIAYSHLEDACQIVQWIEDLVPGFVPPEGGALGTLYRTLGFLWTERVLAFRRSLVALGRQRRRARRGQAMLQLR